MSELQIWREMWADDKVSFFGFLLSFGLVAVALVLFALKVIVALS